MRLLAISEVEVLATISEITAVVVLVSTEALGLGGLVAVGAGWLSGSIRRSSLGWSVRR